jgi:cyanate permease
LNTRTFAGKLGNARQIVASSAGALGALLMGLALEVTGSYRAPLAAVIVVQMAAIVALAWQGKAGRAQTDVKVEAVPERAAG